MPDDVRTDFISYVIGDDRPVAWQLLEHDDDALAAGGFRAYCQVRDAPAPTGTVLQEWSTDNQRARILEREDVGWVVELLVDDSRTWPWWERGHFDLFLVDPLGRAAPITAGSTWVNVPAYTEVPPAEPTP